eukprot:SAG31_NODE_5440_length_2537_cov_2.097211_1_plen_68_part_10
MVLNSSRHRAIDAPRARRGAAAIVSDVLVSCVSFTGTDYIGNDGKPAEFRLWHTTVSSLASVSARILA